MNAFQEILAVVVRLLRNEFRAAAHEAEHVAARITRETVLTVIAALAACAGAGLLLAALCLFLLALMPTPDALALTGALLLLLALLAWLAARAFPPSR